MSIDEIKSNWKNVEGDNRSQNEISKMTQLKNHPKLNRLRIKFIIETIALVFFLLVFQDFFDAERHSQTMNLLLALSAVLYVVNDVYGFFVIKNPIQGDNLIESSKVFLKKLKFLSITSISSSLLFSIMVIVYFSSIVILDKRRLILLGIFALTLIGMFIIMARDWKGKISKIEEFNGELV